MKFKVKYKKPYGKSLWWTEPDGKTSSLEKHAYIYNDDHEFSENDTLLFKNKDVVLVVQH